MKRMKLLLNESLISNKHSDVIEDLSIQAKPNYQIIDVTVIPDEEYYPTIQSILIDLDEANRLCESEADTVNINILSETVNQKTGYSNSLFEFESTNHTITLSLVLQESSRRGVYKVEAYTTKGIKVFESTTYKPKSIIESYLKSLANEYLIDAQLKEAEDAARDLGIEPGSDEEEMLNSLYEEPEEPVMFDDKVEKTAKQEPTEYSVEQFMQAHKLTDDIMNLNIDYSEWNNLSQEEREALVKPELQRFVTAHKNEFDKDRVIFDLIQYNLSDYNFHTEAKVLRDLYK